MFRSVLLQTVSVGKLAHKYSDDLIAITVDLNIREP